MKIAIAIDSYKGSLSSREANESAKRGFQAIFPEAGFTLIELADGGEGTSAALSDVLGCKEASALVTSPIFGRKTLCRYARAGRIAIIEMAQAAGLPLVSGEDKNPMKTTTYGVGEAILAAAGEGARDFIIGLGGSATNDAGTGMLTALGYRFLDRNQKPIPFGAAGLESLETIDPSGRASVLDECTFTVACDVRNPLCGEKGCSAVFAPQKGARAEDIPRMDASIAAFAKKANALSGTSFENAEGSGAAGGMGFAFLTFLGGRLTPGIDLILERAGADKAFRDADLVITGEGRLDKTTAMGKAPSGVARLAKQYGKPVLAFGGCIGEGAELCHEAGIDAYFPILRETVPLEQAMDTSYAAQKLEATAEEVARLIRITAKN